MPDLAAVHEALGWLLPFDFLQPRFMRQALLGLLLLSPMTATLGVQVVNLRLAFFSDAVGHSAFAGVALGLLLAVDPRFSAVALALLIGAGITFCQRRARLSGDSVVGVFFSGVVAAGLAAASRERGVARSVQAFLYGDILTLDDSEIMLAGAALAATLFFQFLAYDRMLYLGVDPSLARAHGAGAGGWQYLFSALLSLAAIFSVWTVGVFLVTAMLVVPAAAARNLARSAGGMFWWAMLISLSSAIIGLAISAQPWARTATGATVILIALAWFAASLALCRW
ncbi:MAG: metal ABC transporter permease, partial [Planctomycetota bacterium]|nr:metal ABC transporter permease [Planctomycetota bacterium]